VQENIPKRLSRSVHGIQRYASAVFSTAMNATRQPFGSSPENILGTIEPLMASDVTNPIVSSLDSWPFGEIERSTCFGVEAWTVCIGGGYTTLRNESMGILVQLKHNVRDHFPILECKREP
jgi:hypothetical protein